MPDNCSRCGDVIAADGYCAGCGWRPPPPPGPDAVFHARLGRGHLGYVILILAAVSLYSFGAVTRNFTDVETARAEESWAGLMPGESAPWWWVALLTVAMVSAVRVLMTRFTPEPAFRIAVWSSLVAGWIFGGFLGYKCAAATTAARSEADRRSDEAEKALKDVREQKERLTRPLSAAAFDYPALASAASPPRVGPPRSDSTRELLLQLDALKFRAVDGLVKADSLRLQSRFLLAALLAAMGAVVSLLFLVAAEQTWCSRALSVVPPPPAAAKPGAT
jgi:hypothetical protein